MTRIKKHKASQPTSFCSSRTPKGGRAGVPADISIYGQESNYFTWRQAKINHAIHGIDGQIAHGNTFQNDRQRDLKANLILANPPFNVFEWGGERLRVDVRWKYGMRMPPSSNGNFAWVQHIRASPRALGRGRIRVGRRFGVVQPV